MSCAVMADTHPRTLLGAALAMLEPAVDAQGRHLQAHAACLLGDYPRARRLWEALAQEGDDEAMAQLTRLARLARGVGGAE
ncbi:hypothetical protein [Oryzisolibacter sp. LB2S]|uniref:hypothetical protein n=1 Tax=Alicycliphilus soli TaxID=3228789 RepID=UPI003458E11D